MTRMAGATSGAAAALVGYWGVQWWLSLCNYGVLFLAEDEDGQDEYVR